MKNSLSKSKLAPGGAGRELVSSRLYTLAVIVVMSLAVMVVYWSPAIPNTVLIGSDYIELHSRRMEYAREALFGPENELPAWYSRELLGTPFWSNIQNFPFIPTRLLVLFTMEPNGPHTYGNAITLSALLAALSTYLFLRKTGLRPTGAAVAGWTFACSGYFASRVAAGHLPLLEAYPALPLLMWTAESLIQALERGDSPRRWLAVAAIFSACVMLAGHPQLPVYAMSVAALYALWRGGFHRALWMWAAMMLGIGVAAFSLVPMSMLVGRSTRILALRPAFNDLSMPYGRLAAFFAPWRDGVPPLLDPDGFHPFSGYPNLTYFWDTVCYIGLLPWVSLLLLSYCAARTKLDGLVIRIGLFIAAIGAAGIVLSLPLIHQATAMIPGTIFRSPARIIYLTEFALAVALGAGVHWITLNVRPIVYRVAGLSLLVIHFIDLGSHDRRFILRGSLDLPAQHAETITRTLKQVSDGRVAIDYALSLPMDRTIDDIGFFDSIMLARSYRLVLDLAGAPSDLNIQNFNGSELSSRALAALGVKFVLTKEKLTDHLSEGQVLGINIYRIPAVAPRAEFFPADRVQYLSGEEIHAALRDPKTDLHSMLLLPRGSQPSEWVGVTAEARELPSVAYRRADSDHIECVVSARKNGYLRIIESWDPGWSATVDGTPVPIIPALNALLAVPITPGRHLVHLVYRTPGVNVGLAISFASLILLGGLVWISGGVRGNNCNEEDANTDTIPLVRHGHDPKKSILKDRR